MSETQKQALLVNLNRSKAQHIIHNGLYDACDYRAVFELYLRAFGDLDLAHRAKSMAAEQYVEAAIRANANQTTR